MLKIYGRANSINVQKVLWAADECGVAFERIDVGGAFGGNDQSWYLAMNPNGVVPVIDDDGYILWESHSIVRYLAAKHAPGTLWPADPQMRGEAERWMDWQQTTLQAGMTALFWGWVRTPQSKRHPATLEAARLATAPLWQRLDDHLASRAFIVGDRFTIGDIPLGAMCYRWLALPFERGDLPAYTHLRAWYDRLCERPSYRDRVRIPMT
jgi:glutathione S-transferase